MTTPESRDKLDSTLTPNYLTYLRPAGLGFSPFGTDLLVDTPDLL